MKTPRWCFGCLTVVLLVIVGCDFVPGDPLGFTPAQMKVAKGILAQPMDERLRAFEALPIADQYGVYRYGCTREIPAVELRAPLARHGAELLPLIRTRLATHGDLGEVRDDLALLLEIHHQGVADVAADSALMSLLKERASGLQSPLWREGCAEQIAALSLPDSASSAGAVATPR